jgi:VCBS repeat protein
MNRAFLTAGIFACAAPLALAQQFQQVGTGLPGPVVSTQGIEPLDANGDGWMDILNVNDTGLPTLLINHTTVGGTITFVNETAARIPAGFTIQGRGLAVCDVDNDGDIDAVFATGSQQQRILINNGTGVFTDETAQRFPTLVLNSWGVAYGDVDNDGDLDLVFNGQSAKAHLLINDGTGHFADDVAFQAVAVNMPSAEQVNIIDIDNDWDLDVIVDGKHVGQQLYVNDGTGHFTYDGSTLPAGSQQTYATGWADLDNDDDIDGAYISLTSSTFNEGTAENNLVPSGNLTFTGTTGTLIGENGDDDNDLVFIDANNDGILDLIIASLGNNKEKLYLNDGTFNPGSFVYQSNGFTTLTDSTLDMAVADFDNDNRYDACTAQGESGDFTDRVYRNTGPVDTVPPRIGRVEAPAPRVPLSVIQGGGHPARAWVQDATFKRGQTFAQADLDVTAFKSGSTQEFTVPMSTVGGGMFRGTIEPAASPDGTVGMDVSFQVHATDPGGNASDSASETFRICGSESYGTALPNSTGLPADATGVNEPSVQANNFKVQITHMPPNQRGRLLYGTAKVVPGIPQGNGLRYIGGTITTLARVIANAQGVGVVPFNFTQPPLSQIPPGETRFFQLLYNDPAAGGVNLSDALEITICD